MIEEDRKIIHPSKGRDELHDLSGDPAENTNLASALPEETAHLKQGLLRFYNSFDHHLPSGTEFEIDEKDQEQLKALGYIN